MPTVITTPGAPNANSYVSLVEADSYHATRLFSTWDTLSVNTQQIAVIQATRLLDSMYEWAGYPTSAEQALLWPRTGPEGFNEWNYVGALEIPDRLKDAVSEFAWQLTLEDRQADSDLETSKIRSLSAGPVSLSFEEGVTAKVIPDAVAILIPSWWGWLKGAGGIRDAERS
jgi:hypothetical protein